MVTAWDVLLGHDVFGGGVVDSGLLTLNSLVDQVQRRYSQSVTARFEATGRYEPLVSDFWGGTRVTWSRNLWIIVAGPN